MTVFRSHRRYRQQFEPYYQRERYMHEQNYGKRVHKFTIKSNRSMPYIDYIKQEKKTVEGRVNSRAFEALRVGDYIELYNHFDRVLCEITFLHRYKDFRQMILSEGLNNLLPGIDSIDQGIEIYNQFPASHRVHRLGVLAIGLKVSK